VRWAILPAVLALRIVISLGAMAQGSHKHLSAATEPAGQNADFNSFAAEPARGAGVEAPPAKPSITADPHSYVIHNGRGEPLEGLPSVIDARRSGGRSPGRPGSEFADTKKIYLLRGSKKPKFNYKEVIKGKNMGQNIRFKNGDQIIVA
jgi:hypothetical protein